MKDDESTPASSFYGEIYKPDGQVSETRAFPLGAVGPHLEQFVASGRNPQGEYFQSVHEVDETTGLIRLVSTTDPDFNYLPSLLEQARRPPWWRLRLDQVSTVQVELHVVPVILHGPNKGQAQDSSIWHCAIPLSVFTVRLMEIVIQLIKAEIDRLRPTPAGVAALALLSGQDNLYEEAGRRAQAMQEPILVNYLVELIGFLDQHAQTMFNDFLCQTAAEADLAARSTVTTDSENPSLRKLRSEADARIAARHVVRPGRRQTTSSFGGRLALLEAVFQSVFGILDERGLVTQADVAARIFKDDDGRALRRQLKECGFSWSTVKAGAIAAYESNEFPR